jgi:uncharacterized protein YgiM (DUF1202 family)
MKYFIFLLFVSSCVTPEKQTNLGSNSNEVKYLYINSVSGGNLRNGASTQAQIVVTIPFGEKVKITNSSEFPEWYKVEYQNSFGYIHQSVLGNSEDIAGKVQEKITYDKEVNDAKNVLANINTMIISQVFDVRADCIFGGGSCKVQIANKTPYNIEAVRVKVTVYRDGTKYVVDEQIIESKNIKSNTNENHNIIFGRGCDVISEVICIQSGYLGISCP